MYKKTTYPSAFVNQRGLIAVLFCAVCFTLAGTLLAFLHADGVTNVSQRTLTFAERVGYQRAIEGVYWRHRIWPKERPDPKPSLDAAMSQAQLEKKVEEYLRKSQALEDYWHRPITAEQLQAEMDRMSRQTKQPEVLRELFAALGNDPFVIAECLARPALAERLLTDWYAYDQRIHGELKQRVETELRVHLPTITLADVSTTLEQMKQLSGMYTEVEFIKTEGAEIGQPARNTVKLKSREWEETVRTLAATFNEPGSEKTLPPALDRPRFVHSSENRQILAQSKNATAEGYDKIPAGRLSLLQENADCYYVMTVTQSKAHLKVAMVKWVKEPLESWLSRAENPVFTVRAGPNSSYTLPAMSNATGGCIDDTWAASSLGLPDARDAHTAVWTGSEVIIWGGGFGSPFTAFNTGGRYNPSTHVWTATSTINAPSPRGGHSAVWTGSEMIVWGGGWINTGARYNPGSDSWVTVSTTNAPTGRSGHTAVWTGTQMVIWGGFNGSSYLNTGGIYNPSTNTWTATSTTNAPVARDYHAGVWTGTQMIVWGGSGANYNHLNTGGRYNPTINSWTSTTTVNAPSARELHTAVWTGGEMIIWGGSANDNFNSNTGGRYNPLTDTWVTTGTTNAPAGRYYHTAVWDGSEMIVWGGQTSSGFVNTGGRYNPSTNHWTATSTINAPPSRLAHTAVWTGTEMFVWGGVGNFSQTGALNTGGQYDPSTDTWISNNPPIERIYQTAISTGSEMIVWGGVFGNLFLNSGAKYSPATETWTPTSTTGAPTGRIGHTAIWTGTEMIVWGGVDFTTTGGRYNPITNSWQATSTGNGVPEARSVHTAIWTGTEMIVWGGSNGYNALNSGGRYNPTTDEWGIATITVNAPSGRSGHTAVWTGNEMIVWGGSPDIPIYYNALNTGGRYNPITDSWTATSLTSVPSARVFHSAVWTGNEMIVWGGAGDSYFTNSVNTGGRYNPDGDSWTATSLSNVPSARADHTAVWTDTEMIVWGGGISSAPYRVNTGGRYIPGTDSWTRTSTSNNVPSARYRHTTVRIGNQMITWGGIGPFGMSTSGGNYCADSGQTPTPTPTSTPTPTPCMGRCSPTPRPRPDPAPRP
jgi:N-acetylneuraminic acid mutarotase